jgi:hypothetical protein
MHLDSDGNSSDRRAVSDHLQALPMKILMIISTFIIIINFNIFSQINNSGDHVDDIYETPTFPGGPEHLWCFLESNFKYDILNSDQKKISYLITFYIDSLGIARDLKFSRVKPELRYDHVDSLRRAEILRVLALMPKWKLPGEFNKNLKSWVGIPIMTPYTEFRCKKKNRNNNH